MKIRVLKSYLNDYFVNEKSYLIDSRLSFKEKGLLTYLLSLNEEQDISVNEIVSISCDGRKSVYKIIRNLITLGYISKNNISKGKVVYCVNLDGSITNLNKNVSLYPKGPNRKNNEQSIIDRFTQKGQTEQIKNRSLEDFSPESLEIDEKAKKTLDKASPEYNIGLCSFYKDISNPVKQSLQTNKDINKTKKVDTAITESIGDYIQKDLSIIENPSLISPSYLDIFLSSEKLNFFKQFWDIYPLKRSRGQSMRIFNSLNVDQILLDKMLLSIEAQKSYREKSRSSGSFCPAWKHPARWLQDECWYDVWDDDKESINNGTSFNNPGAMLWESCKDSIE